MIESVRTWLFGVVCTAFAVSLAKELTDTGREGKWVSFAGGLLMVLALLGPLTGGNQGQMSFREADLSRRVREQIGSYEESYQQELSAIIAEKTQAYIWDKGQSMGLALDVIVEVRKSESGLPLPYAVTVNGPYSQVLSDWMAKEVGLPTERQIWLEAQEWSETRENES